MNAIEMYSQSVSSDIPPDILRKAKKIVKGHKPEGDLRGFEPMNFARILLVEDDTNLAITYQMVGQLAGNEVIFASSADEASKILEKDDFDLVVTDGLGGEWKTVREAGNQKGIRTIVVSGDEKIIRDAKEKGGEAIQKGLDDKTSRRIENLFINT